MGVPADVFNQQDKNAVYVRLQTPSADNPGVVAGQLGVVIYNITKENKIMWGVQWEKGPTGVVYPEDVLVVPNPQEDPK